MRDLGGRFSQLMRTRLANGGLVSQALRIKLVHDGFGNISHLSKPIGSQLFGRKEFLGRKVIGAAETIILCFSQNFVPGKKATGWGRPLTNAKMPRR